VLTDDPRSHSRAGPARTQRASPVCPGPACGLVYLWARRLCARRELDAIYVYDYDSTLRFSPELRPPHDLGSASPHLDSDTGSASARFHDLVEIAKNEPRIVILDSSKLFGAIGVSAEFPLCVPHKNSGVISLHMTQSLAFP